MGETCAVCKKGKGPEKCEVCGFSDNGFINRQFPIPEDTKNWIETVVKPYRVQWEKAELLQLEAAKSSSFYTYTRKGKVYRTSKSDNTFTDPRDGRVYRTVKIGEQIWLAENLAYDAEGSKCYNNDESNCQKYGRLYDWDTAMKASPDGWHLPSDDEWQTLVDFVGGKEIAGKILKATGGWNYYEGYKTFREKGRSGNGTDDFGFSALPGGFSFSDGEFGEVGRYGRWWSAGVTELGAWSAYIQSINNYSESLDKEIENKSQLLFSIRCLQGNSPVESPRAAELEPPSNVNYGTFTDPRDGRVYRTVKIGEQIWLAENLAYNEPGSKRFAYDEKYGRIYDWDTAMKACPEGWHLPSDDEWQTLVDFVGGKEIAGKKLKATSGWWDKLREKKCNGTDDFGFSALPGGTGSRRAGKNTLGGIGSYGSWWGSSKELFIGAKESIEFSAKRGYTLLSVRCIKDL